MKKDKKKKAYQLVLKDIKENGPKLFSGCYDATNGNAHFMYGIGTVIEFLAHNAEDEEFENIFYENAQKSIDKAKRV